MSGEESGDAAFSIFVLFRRIGKSEEFCEDLRAVKNKVKYFVQHEDESWMVDLVRSLIKNFSS